MTGLYFTNNEPDPELDYRRAEAIAKIASFAPKLYELDRLRRYVTQYERPEGGGEDYEAPAERRQQEQEERTGASAKLCRYDALSEMTGELLRRTAQTISVPELEQLAKQIEADVKRSRKKYGIKQRTKSMNGSARDSGPVEVDF